MSNLLVYILILQALSAVAMLFSKNEISKKIALAASLIIFGLSASLFASFDPNGGKQFVINYPWLPSFGISFYMAMDGISFLLVQLTNFLIPLIVLSSFNREIKNAASFYALIFLMQFALTGVFTALDGFLFYIFWELALIPIWFICLMWGGTNSARITVKFFIYTLTGSLFMLIGLIYMYIQTPETHSFAIEELMKLNLSSNEQSWLFWCFFLAFAIKMPVWPLHTWQPDTYTDAPTQGTMLLSGIMLKMGVYGVIRWMLPLIPQGVMDWSMTAVVLSVIGIVYASCLALVQKDYKRLIAYSSIAHVGLISAGVFSLNVQGLQGAVVQMIAHGVNVVGLFMIADILLDRFKSRNLNELGGIANQQGLFAILFVIIMLGSVALPLTNGFVGEFLLLTAVYKYNAYVAVFAGLTVILGAVYMLRSYQAIMLGDKVTQGHSFGGLMQTEKIVLIIICAVIIITGIESNFILKIAEPSVKEVLSRISF